MPSMSPKEVLILARRKIEQPKGWTQENYAANKDGLGVSYTDKAAMCFCSSGAVLASSPSPTLEPESLKYLAYVVAGPSVKPELYPHVVIRWNDDSERTHQEVLAVFDAAIAAASDVPIEY